MEIPRSERAGVPGWVPVLALASAAATALAIVTIDQPLARALARYEPLPIWDAGTEVLEWAILLPVWRFALPVALVAGMLATMLAPRWRIHAPAWIFAAGVHLATRYTVNELKDATGRLRPGAWLARGGDETFGWLGGISFPSGHVVLFTGLAVPLLVLFPRSRVVVGLALAMIVFISAARVGVNAHFVSDALGAITLVAATAWLVGLGVRPRRASPPR